MANNKVQLGSIVEVKWTDAPNERGIVVGMDKHSLDLLCADTTRRPTPVERDQVVAVHGNVLKQLNAKPKSNASGRVASRRK